MQLLVLVSLFFLFGPVAAQVEPESAAENLERRFLELKEMLSAEVEEILERRQRARPSKSLGRSLRLEFKLEPAEEGAQSQWISVASENYGLHLRRMGREGSFSFGVEGKVSLEESGIGLSYHADLEFRGDGQGGSVSAHGSALVPPGEWYTLAKLGEKSLLVQISLEP